MKKRVVALLLAGVLVFSNGIMVMAEGSGVAEDLATGEQIVSAEEEAGQEVITTEKVEEAEKNVPEEEVPEAATEVEAEVEQEELVKVEEEVSEKDAEVVVAAETKKYNLVEPKDTIEAAKKGDVLLLDARPKSEYDKGHLKGAVNVPSLDDKNIAQTEALEGYARVNLVNTSKDVYIICIAGAKYAPVAYDCFLNMGIAESRLHIVRGGTNNGLEFSTKDEYNQLKRVEEYITINQAIENSKMAKGKIVDVRTEKAYSEGHIENSLWATVANGDADRSKFLAAVKDLEEIYILGDTGSEDAEQAQLWLKGSGKKVYTISGGHDKNLDAPWVMDFDFKEAEEVAKEALSGEAIVLDVRAAKDYGKSKGYDSEHMKGAINVPIFGENLSSPADVVAAFTRYAEENLVNSSAPIYLVDYDGQVGVWRAAAALKAAGIDAKRICGVQGGQAALKNASSYVEGVVEEPDKPSTDKPSTDKPSTDKPSTDKPSTDKPSTDKPSTNKPSTNKPSINKPATDKPSKAPQTGDVAPITGLVVAMGIAAGVVAVVIKKRRTF